jgi:hypothetical protein
MTLNERIASLEILADVGKEDREELHIKIAAMDKKLDSLLELKQRGVGAFWLASGLFGTGIIGFFYALIDWIRGTQ